jgi:hypothetical protein
LRALRDKSPAGARRFRGATRIQKLKPLPRDSRIGEIPTEIDTHPRAMYFQQARIVMWIRAALLVYLFDAGQRIASRYRKDSGEYHDHKIGAL